MLYPDTLFSGRLKPYKRRIQAADAGSRCLSTVLLSMTMLFSAQAAALSLQQAEQFALQADPLVASEMAESRAYTRASTADGTLPDPQLRFGLFNLPLDTFSTTQEPMTQLAVGIQQQFPRGDVLDLKQQQSQWLAKAALAKAENTRYEIRRDLRETFLNLYYEIEAGRIIRESRNLFAQLVKITEAQYAAGRVNQQDVIRADLELTRLDDRSSKIQGEEDEYRANLAQWIGESAWGEIDSAFPTLPPVPDTTDINEVLTHHPLINAQTAQVESSRKMTDMTRQDYRPGVNAFVEYRKRFGVNADGSDRSDMMAAMITVDIPLFTENRQDKNVAAAEEKTASAQYARDDKLRLLHRMLDKDRAIYKRLGERELIYKNRLLDTARSNADASLNAYQSGVTEFTSVMRARITELDARLDDLRVRIDRARATARLLYITGEPK
jgi:outer membrane protein TolC